MEPRKKILLLPLPMKGHLCHSARLAEWFLEHPEEYEVHISTHHEAEVYLPEGIVFHPNPHSLSEKQCVDVFGKCSEGRTAIEALAIMFSGFNDNGWDLQMASMKFIMEEMKKIKPDVVVYEHAHNMGNIMHTFCKQLSIPSLMLVAMARPETALSPLVLLGCLLFYKSSTWPFIKRAFSVAKDFEPIVGCKMLPESDKPIILYPGAQILCEKPPQPHEIYTGPFYPLPVKLEADKARGELPRRSSLFSLNFQVDDDELREWVEDKRDGELPFIYIALGTLATPSSELLQRLVEALDGGPWNIIWALPEAHQARLPKKLSRDQWYVDKFLPQFSIFQAKFVKCFISHCGGSSTTEAIANGIPMLCVPFFGDQFEWAASISSHIKAGIQIDKFKTTSKGIKRDVEKILNDRSFEDNAKEAAEKMIKNAELRLDFLGAKLEGKQIRVGIPVAAAMLEKLMAGKDPRDVLPPNLRVKVQQKTPGCCPCVS